ncbi:unnamed protein product [Pleuronectes platessa]|uniref:Uncharacterized protein n=1 Tax=Pleuronectes platessa TaxID=8262 RepID=A0A9N7YFR8_PLEPL|nr:unnamed protein product [Pleuronectes platessa]
MVLSIVSDGVTGSFGKILRQLFQSRLLNLRVFGAGEDPHCDTGEAVIQKSRNMSSSMCTTAEGVLVVTHVHPFPQDAPRGAGLPHCVGIQKFSKIHPYVLGTIQIMVGLTVLLFGVTMGIPADTLTAFIGFWVWGALIYITAGSLTVAAGKHLTRRLVNTALGWDQMMGLSGIMGLVNLLEFIVSVVVAGIACKATCNCSGEPSSVIVIPAASGLPEVPAAAPPLSQVQDDSKNPQQPRAASVPEPPTYDSVLA